MGDFYVVYVKMVTQTITGEGHYTVYQPRRNGRGLIQVTADQKEKEFWTTELIHAMSFEYMIDAVKFIRTLSPDLQSMAKVGTVTLTMEDLL